MKDYIIAVDGPAGSGKSTISKIVAKELGFTYLDTGAMYRMITYFALQEETNLEDDNKVENLLNRTDLDIQGDKFILNGKDISKEIRGVEVTQNVSKIAAIKAVREKLVDMQRDISKGKKVILDGRDIGTVVFPNADLKVFLVASPEERAKRRVKDFASKGVEQSFDEVLKDIIKRDKMDSERKESPLKQAEDAILVDTSNMSIEEVCGKIIGLVDIK